MNQDHRLSLLLCKDGTCGKIVELATGDRKVLGKLMSLGIVPGAFFRLLRRRPGFLLEVGYTKVALDQELARFIIIEKSVSKSFL